MAGKNLNSKRWK